MPPIANVTRTASGSGVSRAADENAQHDARRDGSARDHSVSVPPYDQLTDASSVNPSTIVLLNPPVGRATRYSNSNDWASAVPRGHRCALSDIATDTPAAFQSHNVGSTPVGGSSRKLAAMGMTAQRRGTAARRHRGMIMAPSSDTPRR